MSKAPTSSPLPPVLFLSTPIWFQCLLFYSQIIPGEGGPELTAATYSKSLESCKI